jgi:hypothetical protein
MARKRGMFKNFDPEQDKAAVAAATSDEPNPKRSKWSEEFINSCIMYQHNNGDNFIDIIPFEAEEDFANLKEGTPNWRLVYKQHVNIGPNKETVVCPRTYGEKCPICDEYDKVRFNFPGEKGSQENKEYYNNVVKPLQPKSRAIYGIVDRRNEEESNKGVQYMDMSTFYIEDNIDAYAKDRRGEPIFYQDPDDGKIIHYTWEVDEEARKKGQQSAPDFKIVGLVDRELPLENGEMKPYEVSDEELDEMKPLGKWIFNLASDEEIKEMMEGTASVSVTKKNSEYDAQEQLDRAFGKREERVARNTEEEPPFEPDKEEEKPSRSRGRSRNKEEDSSNPLVAKLMKMETVDEIDTFCEENVIDVFAEDFGSVEEFREAVLEFVK